MAAKPSKPSKPRNPSKTRTRTAKRSSDPIENPDFDLSSSGPDDASGGDPDERLADVDLVKATLRAILLDRSAPAAARAQAARTLAEMSGALGRNAKPAAAGDKPVAEMTKEEMLAELAALGG